MSGGISPTSGISGSANLNNVTGNLGLANGGTGGTDAATAKAALGITTANQLSVFAAGTAYSLTNTAAALTFGTTSPALTINAAGTYLIIARCRLNFNAATFVATRTTTIKLRRTNNTAADLTNGAVTGTTIVSVSALTYTFIDQTWAAIYTTSNADDALTLFGSIDTAPGAGSVDAAEASIIAIRLQT